MFKTLILVFRIIFWMLHRNKKLKKAIAADEKGDYAERDRIVQENVPAWARYVFEITHSEVEVINKEKIPQDRAVVFIGNHQGAMDIPVLLGYTDKPLAFVAKSDLQKIPCLSSWMDLMQCTFLDRKSPRKSVQAMHHAADGVKRGYSQVIFPEGTRSLGGKHETFKPGSFKLAYMTDAPIVPFTLDGTWTIYEKTGHLQKGKVKLIIHDPIETKGLTKEEQQALPARIEKICCDPLPEPIIPKKKKKKLI